jgi:hypothetical protein
LLVRVAILLTLVAACGQNYGSPVYDPARPRMTNHGTPRTRAPFLCAGVGLTFSRPARLEWSAWLGGGAGWTDAGSTGALRVGAVADFSVARFGRVYDGGAVELRLGPWLGVDALPDAQVIEAGPSLDLGTTGADPWGELGLRLGAGVERVRDTDAARATLSATLTWGHRYTPARQSEGGGCVGGEHLEIVEWGDAPHPAARSQVARGFATWRVDSERASTLLFGVEVAP